MKIFMSFIVFLSTFFTSTVLASPHLVFRAASSGDVEGMIHLFQSGADLNFQNELGQTPLHLATIAGNRALLRYLLANGSSPRALNSKGQSIFHLAVIHGHHDLLGDLIELGIFNYNFQDANGNTVLHLALMHSNFNGLARLLAAGVRLQDAVDSTGATAAHLAASSGDLKSLIFFVEHGVDINVLDSLGDTLLHAAASNGQDDIVNYLITSRGFDFDVQNIMGDTPMHLAVDFCHVPTVQLLLSLGAKPFTRNSIGDSPIERAKDGGFADVEDLFCIYELGRPAERDLGMYYRRDSAVSTSTADFGVFNVQKENLRCNPKVVESRR